MADQGHWYTDKNGNHYFVGEGETPKEGWERSKRRKMIDGGKYKVDDGDGKGSREVSMEEYNKYEADDDFDETTDDDFGFDEEEDNVADDANQYFDDLFTEMRKNGIDMGDKQEILQELGANYGMDRDEQEEFMKYMFGKDYEQRFAGAQTWGQREEDEGSNDEGESLENTDNRGEGANPDFNREKFGKYFNPDGTLKKGMEDEYFAATSNEEKPVANGLADRARYENEEDLKKDLAQTNLTFERANTSYGSTYSIYSNGDYVANISFINGRPGTLSVVPSKKELFDTAIQGGSENKPTQQKTGTEAGKDNSGDEAGGKKNPNGSEQNVPDPNIPNGRMDDMGSKTSVNIKRNDDGTLTISGNDGDIDQFMELYNNWINKGKK